MTHDPTSEPAPGTYTFADVFTRDYIPKMKEMLGAVELSNSSGTDPAKGKDKSCAELAADSKDWFTKVYP
jgi:hypothetical protein